MKKLALLAIVLASALGGAAAQAQLGDYWSKPQVSPVVLVVPNGLGSYRPVTTPQTLDLFSKAQVVPIVMVEHEKYLPLYKGIGDGSLMHDTWQKEEVRPVAAVEPSPATGLFQLKKGCKAF